MSEILDTAKKGFNKFFGVIGKIGGAVSFGNTVSGLDKSFNDLPPSGSYDLQFDCGRSVCNYKLLEIKE